MQHRVHTDQSCNSWRHLPFEEGAIDTSMGHASTTAKSAFEEQVDAASAATKTDIKALPLTHVTDWAGFIAISKDGQFASKKPCPVYGKPLVYAFYGRPAYRLRDDGLSHSLPTFSPVCFVLRADLIKSAERMMPFDSGGFSMYAAAMHPSLTLADYELTVGTASTTRVVSFFWGSNADYYGTKFLDSLTIGPAAVALTHYYSLISNKLSTVFDNRCSTIELQFPSPLQLTGIIDAIIVPSGVAGSEAATIASSLNAELLTYEFEMPYKISDFHVSIRTVVRDFLLSRGIL